MQALSEEMLKLKSASEHYEETKENLLKICKSLDEISLTHRTLTDNMKQALSEMEEMNLDSTKTREFIQSLYEEAKNLLKAEARKYEDIVEASLAEKCNKISDEFRKETERIHQENVDQSRSLRLVKSLIVVGIVMEAVIIIRMFLF